MELFCFYRNSHRREPRRQAISRQLSRRYLKHPGLDCRLSTVDCRALNVRGPGRREVHNGIHPQCEHKLYIIEILRNPGHIKVVAWMDAKASSVPRRWEPCRC